MVVTTPFMAKPKPISAEFILVTPAMAQEWLKKNHPDNRSISWPRVEGFANDMREGAWKATHQGIAFNKDDQLTDGQHRLHAVVAAKKNVYLYVVHNPNADIHDPIDRGRPRSMHTVTGLSARVTGALAMLHRMEYGIPVSNVPVSVAETLATMKHHEEALQRIDDSGANQNGIIAGLRAACVWAMPIDAEKTIDFLQKAVSGEMIKRGDPAYAFRGWHDRTRASSSEVMFAAMNCLRHHLQGKPLSSVYTTDIGYRAGCSKRRALRAPYTPSADLVAGVSWAKTENKQGGAVTEEPAP